MSVELISTSQGEDDPQCCGSCMGPIGIVVARGGLDYAFVPYVVVPDCDDPDQLIGYDLDCAVRHCGVIIEVRG